MDVQSAFIDEDKLTHFHSEEVDGDIKIFAKKPEIDAVKNLLQNSERPVIICGQ